MKLPSRKELLRIELPLVDVWIFGWLEGEPEEAVGPPFGDNAAVGGLEDRRVEAIEAADQVGVLDHRPPDPVVVFFSNEIGEEAGEIGDGHRNGRQTAAIF